MITHDGNVKNGFTECINAGGYGEGAYERMERGEQGKEGREL